MSNFTVKGSKSFNAQKKTFSVKSEMFLEFSKCTIKDYPVDKRDFQEIINALSAFKSQDELEKRAKHKLTKKDKGTNSARLLQFIKDYTDVWSIDVYHRNSSKGKYRLIYTKDFDDASKISVLDCFIDTH